MMKYYKELFKKKRDILKQLTDMFGKNSTFTWDEKSNRTFIGVKAMIIKATMFAFPDFTKPFDFHTDSSDYQLEIFLSQDGKLIAFFSRKLNFAQLNYTVNDKELLGITKSLKHFHHILLGNEIKVYTNHEDLTYSGTNFNSNHRLRQRLLIEEYGAELIFVAGIKNVIADGISRLELETNHETKEKCSLLDKNEHFTLSFDL